MGLTDDEMREAWAKVQDGTPVFWVNRHYRHPLVGRKLKKFMYTVHPRVMNWIQEMQEQWGDHE